MQYSALSLQLFTEGVDLYWNCDIFVFFVCFFLCKIILAKCCFLPQTAKRLLTSSSAKTEWRWLSGWLSKSTTGTSVSSVAPYTRGRIDSLSSHKHLLVRCFFSSGNDWKLQQNLSSSRSEVSFSIQTEQRPWEQCNILHGEMRFYIGQSKWHGYSPEVYVVSVWPCCAS